MQVLNVVTLCLCLTSLCAANLHIASFPDSIKLSDKPSTLKVNEVGHVVTALMGFSTEMTKSWDGLKSFDMFDRPQANLFIDLQVPDEVNIQLETYPQTVEIEGQHSPSMEEFNLKLKENYEEPLIVSLELDGKMISTSSYNSDLFSNLPVTLTQIRQRLIQGDSVANKLSPNSCLDLTSDQDTLFLGEIQTVVDIIEKLETHMSMVEDNTPDSFYFTFMTLRDLVNKYGSTSCQVNEAVALLEEYIPMFVESFKALYKSNLLAEISVSKPVLRSFENVQVRHTRSLQQVQENKTIGNLAEPYMADYAVVVNLTFWVFVVFSLATLATSYLIWFMDPGVDGIVYRMTSTRLKTE